MCRHLAYIGPALPVASLLLDAPHCLADQARAPRFQASGRDNPDGYGVAWYPVPGQPPQRHRSATPIWEDGALGTRLRDVEATAVLAAARLASPGAPVEESGNAPFVSAEWSFSLNGIVDGFHDGVGHRLRASLSPARAAGIEGRSDSEVLFALALDHLDAGASAGDALQQVIGAVTARTTGRLNLLLTDGRRIAATAWGNSLFTLAPGFVASEPLDDDPAWRRVPDHALVAVDGEGVTCEPLEIGAR